MSGVRRIIIDAPLRNKFYEDDAIPANSFAVVVEVAIGQREEIDINEILYKPARQES